MLRLLPPFAKTPLPSNTNTLFFFFSDSTTILLWRESLLQVPSVLLGKIVSNSQCSLLSRPLWQPPSISLHHPILVGSGLSLYLCLSFCLCICICVFFCLCLCCLPTVTPPSISLRHLILQPIASAGFNCPSHFSPYPLQVDCPKDFTCLEDSLEEFTCF